VGMSEANDLEKPQPEPPTGGEAYTVLLCEVAPIYNDSFSIIFLNVSNIFFGS
jgi:hypothetical protein